MYMTSTITEARTLPTGTWHVDPTHSQVGFEVEYMVGTFRGSFSPVEATLAVDEDGTATLTGSARAENVKVQDENLNAHLLSPEFFDAARTPAIEFSASGINRAGDELEVVGELTIKGVTEPVELRGTIADPITDAYGRLRVGLKLATTVDRTRFGLNWNLPLPTGEPALANEVRLTAELYLIEA
jgi:polyisoprenoid-binding protein YceI